MELNDCALSRKRAQRVVALAFCLVALLWPLDRAGARSLGGGAPAGHTQRKIVLLDATGSHNRGQKTRNGAIMTGTFRLPFVPWGITYAYRCASPKEFDVVVGLPIVDGIMPDTEFSRHGLQGRGYYMETGNGKAEWKTLIPAYRSWENLNVTSSCAWHVRVVRGPERVVAAHVPPLPPVGT